MIICQIEATFTDKDEKDINKMTKPNTVATLFNGIQGTRNH